VFLVDCEDSFVNTLADYLRQADAEVLTVRGRMSSQLLKTQLSSYQPDLVFFSPGPGSPGDFDLPVKIDVAIRQGFPVFGVCLGLQGIVQYFGGELATLPHPMHGKSSHIRVLGGRILRGLPQEFVAGRYHSLHAVRKSLPAALEITAESEDGVVMAIEHRSLPVAAVQFHPESIMTLKGRTGLKMIENALAVLTEQRLSALA
ncbi:MAG TPA: gamma-glutamyl-gamma-aminobutyrate hydrolase family protein, partial [Nitrososphaera sp.]|nr:gamma-glutamyl-gamma-aminobutyrate hydrolase family protein [Nitrososphaera sp.]